MARKKIEHVQDNVEGEIVGFDPYEAELCTLRARDVEAEYLTYTELRRDLLQQLTENGLEQAHYKQLVEDYLMLWNIKNDLYRDIKIRGVTCSWDNGGGQKGRKKNDSIAELNKTNAQMLKILSELGLRGANYEKPIEVEEL